MSRHPLGGALRISEDPREPCFSRVLRELWPSPFTSQIENVGLDSAYCPLSRRTGKALFEKDRQAPHAACAHEIAPPGQAPGRVQDQSAANPSGAHDAKGLRASVDTSKPAKRGRRKTGHRGGRSSGCVVARSFLRAQEAFSGDVTIAPTPEIV